MSYILKEEYADSRYDSELKSIWVTYKRYATPKAYRGIVDKLLEAVKVMQANCLVCDSRKQGIVNNDDINYTYERLVEMVGLGLRHQIIIEPESFFTQLSVKKLVEKVADQKDLTIHLVASENQAITLRNNLIRSERTN